MQAEANIHMPEAQGPRQSEMHIAPTPSQPKPLQHSLVMSGKWLLCKICGARSAKHKFRYWSTHTCRRPAPQPTQEPTQPLGCPPPRRKKARFLTCESCGENNDNIDIHHCRVCQLGPHCLMCTSFNRCLSCDQLMCLSCYGDHAKSQCSRPTQTQDLSQATLPPTQPSIGNHFE